jgi:hypothetical protein
MSSRGEVQPISLKSVMEFTPDTRQPFMAGSPSVEHISTALPYYNELEPDNIIFLKFTLQGGGRYNF